MSYYLVGEEAFVAVVVVALLLLLFADDVVVERHCLDLNLEYLNPHALHSLLCSELAAANSYNFLVCFPLTFYDHQGRVSIQDYYLYDTLHIPLLQLHYYPVAYLCQDEEDVVGHY